MSSSGVPVCVPERSAPPGSSCVGSPVDRPRTLLVLAPQGKSEEMKWLCVCLCVCVLFTRRQA